MPPSVETVPPSPVDIVKVYCSGAGVGTGSGSGVTTLWGGVGSSSAEQLYRIRNKPYYN